ncbi:MAG: PAS domain-containing protein [Pseudomonadota bacterium]
MIAAHVFIGFGMGVVAVALVLVALFTWGKGYGLACLLGGVTVLGSVPALMAPTAMPAPLVVVLQHPLYGAVVLLLGVSALMATGVEAVRRSRPADVQRSPQDAAGSPPQTVERVLPTSVPFSADPNHWPQMLAYLELATENSQITFFLQDKDFRYIWIVNPRLALKAEDVIGKSDYEILPAEVHPLIIGHKTRAMATRTKQTFEVEVPSDDSRLWFRVDVVPIGPPGQEPTGIVCSAIEITAAKRVDMMRAELSRRLAETLQRFNLALRSERIMVFSQDLSMRYTWANSDETQIGSLIGRTDQDVIPPDDRGPISQLKQRAISTKKPQSAEVGVGEGDERRWFDLHVEPNVRPDGKVAGITCASIDVTQRKRNEERMHLVMRELTHRTKNLLAVVIAIARQASTGVSDVNEFVPALIGRLRALSVAQDLIVADDWAGVALEDLTRTILLQSGGASESQILVQGPTIKLSPEAAQNLGLALHELAVNARQYGALQCAEGAVSVIWDNHRLDGGDCVALTWREEGGPPVSPPTAKGFGTTVIERNLTRALKAQVDLSFHPAGLEASILVPYREISPVQPTEESIRKLPHPAE